MEELKRILDINENLVRINGELVEVNKGWQELATEMLLMWAEERVKQRKGQIMEELIKRLERVIQTGAPDKDGQHPITAEVVLEVVKAQLSTNLAEVGTDVPDNNVGELISRQAAIDALGEEPPVWYDGEDEIAERNQWKRDIEAIKQLPPIQPKRGKWIHHPEIGWGETWLCDQCGEKTTSTVMGKPRANFCPHCGADMREVKT